MSETAQQYVEDLNKVIDLEGIRKEREDRLIRQYSYNGELERLTQVIVGRMRRHELMRRALKRGKKNEPTRL